MSRSGYSEELDNWALIRWRGAVNAAIKGARGQAFLRELADALDAMPQKRLIENAVSVGGDFCTLGVIANAKQVALKSVEDWDNTETAKVLDVAESLVREIVYENDEGCYINETPAQRWTRMRKWVDRNIIKEGAL
jgi:hypothetical protein